MTGNGLLGSLSSISSTDSIGSEAHQGLQYFHLRDIESPNQAFLLCTFRPSPLWIPCRESLSVIPDDKRIGIQAPS